MARIRSIKPEFFDDPDFCAEFSREERLYYCALWVMCCDDRGAFLDNLRWLKTKTFPYDTDVTEDTIRQWNEHFIQKHKLYPYDVNGKRYFLLVHFLDHQKVDHPSPKTAFPPPPEAEFDEKAWQWTVHPSHLFNHAQSLASPREDSPSPRRALAEPSRLTGTRTRTTTATATGTGGAAAVARTFEAEVARPISPHESDRLCSYLNDGVETEAVCLAIRIARAAGKTNLRYMEGILNKWLAAGAKTLKAAQDYQAAYRSEKVSGSAGGMTSQTSTIPDADATRRYLEARRRSAEEDTNA